MPRTSGDQWIEVYHQACRVPFEFDKRPAIRFILVQSAAESELLIFCHHIICDGLSLAYLARDLMVHLGDPTRDVEVLPDPAPIGLDNMPGGTSRSTPSPSSLSIGSTPSGKRKACSLTKKTMKT